jgi:hypothetical protein
VDKTETKPADFIASLPNDVRPDIEQLDAAISDVMSGHPKTMWEGTFWGGSDQNIIGYGDFTYERPAGTVEWFMVGLAAQKNYISVYVNAADDEAYLTAKYADRLGKVKVGAASISFKSVEDIELDALLELVGRAEEQLNP